MNIRECLNILIDFKIQIQNINIKLHKIKQKSKRENLILKRESLYREFREIERMDIVQGFILKNAASLNLMSPCAGPWCLVNAVDFKLGNNMFYLSIKFKDDDNWYVGEYSLIDNKYGIDNLIILKKLAYI